MESDGWRNSWGNLKENNVDEFWSSLQSSYQYLMNNNLIDSCTEAKRDLNLSPCSDWSFEQLKDKYNELDTWLNSMQKAIYAKEQSITDRNLRLTHIEEMQRKRYQRKNYLSQSTRLIRCYPELKEEISWRFNHLIAKWDRIELTVSPRRVKKDCSDICVDVNQKLRRLGKWIKSTEEKLEPLNFHMNLTYSQLRQKAIDHEIIQKDVQSHRKTVSNIVKLCEKLSPYNSNIVNNNADDNSVNTECIGGVSLNCTIDSESFTNCENARKPRILRIAHHWQHRWHLLYLHCIEWQCHLENLLNRFDNKSPDDGVSDSDDEQPITKHRRLNNNYLSDSDQSLLSKGGKEYDEDMTDTSAISTSDSAQVSVIEDVEMSEVVQVVNDIGESSTPMKCSVDNVELNHHYHHTVNGYPRQMWEEMILNDSAKFNTSDTSARNYGTYYYKHLDTDSEHEKSKSRNSVPVIERRPNEDSSEDEWTYTNGTVSGEIQESDSMDTDVSENDVKETATDVKKEMNNNGDFVDDGEKDSSDTCTNSVSDRFVGLIKLADEEDSVQKLVEKVEELVKEKSLLRKVPSNRKHLKTSNSNILSPGMFRAKNNNLVKKWLNTYHQDNEVTITADSCDASGEYTTEDDDQYERRSSCDQTMTVTGSSQDNGLDVSQSSEQSVADHSKVVLRLKSSTRRSQRPLSTSELTRTSHLRLASQFSVSESAINKIITLKDISTQDNLSSSTMQTLEGSGCSINSYRRRKLKHRRRNTIGQKCHSGSADSLSSLSRQDMHHMLLRSPAKLNSHVMKTGSNHDSLSRRFSSVERGILSEPINCVANSSGTETEEDGKCGKRGQFRKRLSALPAFRLGPVYGTVTQRDTIVTDITSAEEQHSSFSEQAWDSYQEKYMSEAYSEEPVDPEKEKQLLEFGDDYRKYIDSQSECASSITRQTYQFFKHSFVGKGECLQMDSDSESDIKSFIFQSDSQLNYYEQLFAKQTAHPSISLILTESDFGDMKSTCRENIRCLRVLLDNIDQDFSSHQTKDIKIFQNSDNFMASTPVPKCVTSTCFEERCENNSSALFSSRSEERQEIFNASFETIITELRKLKTVSSERDRNIRAFLQCLDADLYDSENSLYKGLLDKWQKIEERTDDLENLYLLQREIAKLRDQLRDTSCKATNMASNLEDRFSLENNICILKGELSNLKENKSQITKCNLDALNLINDSKSASSFLKEDITNLYQIWEETNQKVSQQLESLQRALSTWEHFEFHLRELQHALLDDQHMLQMLDVAIECGKFTSDVATSFYDVYKVLSTKQDVSMRVVSTNSCMTSETVTNSSSSSSSGFCGSSSHTTFSIEGSLSDSGISDSGSEHDLSEREKRLANLKKLVRHLESVLAPGSVALMNIMKRIEETEDDLRELQQTCCTLIAKTSILPEQKSDACSKQDHSNISISKKSNSKTAKELKTSKGDDTSKRKSLLWRVIRAALPFHMAIMVLVCIACLLEPRCCDSLNTFKSSFFPQLRYMSGPPPT